MSQVSQKFELELWYQRWRILQRWKNEKLQQYNARAKREIMAVYERHAVTALCYYGSNWFYFSDFSKVKEEIEGLWKRGVIELTGVRPCRISLVNVIRSFRNATASAKDIPKSEIIVGKYKDFTLECQESVIADLSKKGTPVEINALLLRYECLCPQGQQWAVPKAWLETIMDVGSLDLVLCSSPLNRQVNVPYCSGYLEDGKFGSMGSMFDLHPRFCRKFAGKDFTIEMNPPFVERILSDSVTLVESFLKYAKSMKNPPKMVILFIGPDWKDAEYYLRIKKFAVKTINLVAGKYAYEVGTTGKKIKTSKNSALFIIGSGEINMKGFLEQ